MLIVPDSGGWSATSSKYKKTPTLIFDGYADTYFESNQGSDTYQWVQINFGRELKASTISTRLCMRSMYSESITDCSVSGTQFFPPKKL